MSETRSATPGQYLTFFIAGDEYAVGILRVKEILEYDSITRIPGTAACIRGVMNLRGSVVPVVDLAVKMKLPPSALTSRTCIVVVELDVGEDHLVLGVIADSVSQVIDLRAEEIEPPPAFGTRIAVDYLLGMGKVAKRFVLLLDLEQLLSPAELASASDVVMPAPATAPDAEPARPAAP